MFINPRWSVVAKAILYTHTEHVWALIVLVCGGGGRGSWCY